MREDERKKTQHQPNNSRVTKPLANRIALITGASRGIGYATAIALAKAGAHVVAIARTVGGLEELDDAIQAAGGSATLVPLDLRDTDGIVRLSAALNERYQRLDVLVGNGGVLGPISPLGHVEPKAWDEVMAVNVTANFHLIRAMDPLLRASDAGRAVFVTSGAATSQPRLSRPLLDLQGGAQCAGAHLCRRDRRPPTSASICSTRARPAPRMRAALMPGEDPMTLKTADTVAEQIVAMCLPSFQETGKLYDCDRAGC